MRYTFDTEFLEYPENGAQHLHLVSIGIVREDGVEYYAENVEFNWTLAERHNPWLLNHVRPHLLRGSAAKLRPRIARDILDLTNSAGQPQFWAYFADYDWVVLCSIFGRMIDLPHFFPHFCMDIKQEMVTRGVLRPELPAQEGTKHNALEDARWNAAALRYLGVW